RGPDPGARLAVRIAPLRARAVERHERRSLPVRSASDYRDWTAAFTWTAARQPGLAFRDGAYRRRSGGGRAEQALAARNGGTRVRSSRRAIAGARCEGRETAVINWAAPPVV